MDSPPTARDILSGTQLLVPIATPDDARATADALTSHSPERITLVHVVEKGEGVPDKRSLEQSEQLAFETVDAFRETFPEAKHHVEYNRDVVEGVISAARAHDVDAIAFRPRGGSRIVQFLTGDNALRLVTEADRPVVSFPHTAVQES